MACSVIHGPRLPMTTPTERAQVYFANALLPATLPTPARSKLLLLLPTPCLVPLPMSKTKPSRADADERWDASKNAAAPSASVPGGRADAAERWDTHKVQPALSASSSSVTGSRSTISSRGSSSSRNSNNNKERASSRAASAERWDSQKQQPLPRLQAREIDDDDRSSTGSNDMELDTLPQQPFYAGPNFVVSPEPGMLPMPSFMVSTA